MSAYHANSLFRCKDTLDSADRKVKNGRCFMLFQRMWSEFQRVFSSTSDRSTEMSNKNEGHTNCVQRSLISNTEGICGRWWAAGEQMPLNQQTIMQTAVNRTKYLISPTVLLILLLPCRSHADFSMTFKRRSQLVYIVLCITPDLQKANRLRVLSSSRK